MQSCDYIKPTILCRGWRAGWVSKSLGFRIRLAWVGNLTLPIADYISLVSLSFPTCQIQVERAILSGPPHNASSPGATQGSTTQSFELLTRRRRERRAPGAPLYPVPCFKNCQHPCRSVLAPGSRAMELSITPKTQEARLTIWVGHRSLGRCWGGSHTVSHRSVSPGCRRCSKPTAQGIHTASQPRTEPSG